MPDRSKRTPSLWVPSGETSKLRTGFSPKPEEHKQALVLTFLKEKRVSRKRRKRWIKR
jgi:hypothetical protein